MLFPVTRRDEIRPFSALEKDFYLQERRDIVNQERGGWKERPPAFPDVLPRKGLYVNKTTCRLLPVLTWVVIVILGAGCRTWRSGGAKSHVIELGALLSLTGDLAQSGIGQRAAMEIAVADVGRTIQYRGRPVEVRISYKDTGSNPEQAYEQMHVLRQSGLFSVVGPDTSEEAFQIVPWANRLGMIFVSPSSTAPSLAIAGDNLFRLAPDDSYQARVMAERIISDGKRVVVPVWRDDQYAMDLLSGLRQVFLAQGGFLMRGVRYDHVHMDAEAVAEQLRQCIEETASAFGAAQIAVFMVAFEEAIPLMQAAAGSSVLSSLPWYASDGVAMNPLVVSDEQAGRLAAKVRLTAPQMKGASGKEAEDLMIRLQAQLGRKPESYALAAYDAVWLLVRAHLRAGRKADADVLRNLIPQIAAKQEGMSGNLTLNKAGDRAHASFELLQVQESPSGPAWTILPSK